MKANKLNFNKIVGGKIKEARKLNKKKQGEVAEYLGMSRTNFINIEQGRINIEFMLVYQLSLFLSVPVQWFIPPMNAKALKELHSLDVNFHHINHHTFYH